MTAKRPGRNARGLFAIEVDDLEVWALLDAVDIATAPYSLSDWMRTQASVLMADTIVDRFADRGGSEYDWAPLKESTIRIKEALGVSNPDEPNDRTQEMMRAYTYDRDYEVDPMGATMFIPGRVDGALHQKMYVAEHGWTQGSGDLFPGAYTPPRPIAWLDVTDITMLMTSLQFHIMETIEMMIGGSPIGGFGP